MPERKNRGAKTSTMISVANTTEPRISFDAASTTSKMGRRSASGSSAFSRSRRCTFSTSTIASSTSSPMAIANPPSVMVLIDAP